MEMKIKKEENVKSISLKAAIKMQEILIIYKSKVSKNPRTQKIRQNIAAERGDVPGWVLVVLMTTGLVTAIWTIAAPRLTSILKNSLDAMNGIR